MGPTYIIIISIALYYNYSKHFNNVIENYYHIVIKINSCKLFKKKCFQLLFEFVNWGSSSYGMIKIVA